ncbi:MAG: hypothetical protein KAS66_13830 [Candidatus Omnitrophica bacterium]|nr:hypothetical protein [Candidatus Omnitrophota bacterium]
MANMKNFVDECLIMNTFDNNFKNLFGPKIQLIAPITKKYQENMFDKFGLEIKSFAFSGL